MIGQGDSRSCDEVGSRLAVARSRCRPYRTDRRATVEFMHDQGAGSDYGDEDFWLPGDTHPVLGRPPRVPATAANGAVIQVRVFGEPAILGVPEDQHVRRYALEFLTYLIVRGGSVYQDDIVADLMPEPSRRMAAQRMHTNTYNLRQIFVRLGGRGSYLRLRRHRYVLDRAGFDVDLWTMFDAVADAAAASDVQERAAALRRAVDAYTGPFADGAGYAWLASYQDLVRREYVNAAVALADHSDQARVVLTRARQLHPDDVRLAAAMDRLSLA
jgi:two-component SAPR family response regulator